MKAVNPSLTSGFVLADDDGEPFWFLNTLTITKVGAGHSQGQLSIVDHRMRRRSLRNWRPQGMCLQRLIPGLVR